MTINSGEELFEKWVTRYGKTVHEVISKRIGDPYRKEKLLKESFLSDMAKHDRAKADELVERLKGGVGQIDSLERKCWVLDFRHDLNLIYNALSSADTGEKGQNAAS